MDKNTFIAALDNDSPESLENPYLKAMWFIYKDDWPAAHEIVDGPPGELYAWLHAIVHRMEGDRWNAEYWYRRAGRSYPSNSMDEEKEIALEVVLKSIG